MIAWVAARMDPGHYGERIAFRFPTDTTTQGPRRSRPASTRTTRSARSSRSGPTPGSSIIRGNLLVLPIGDDGLLYVEPIFLQAEGAPFPEFVRVIMVDQERVAFAETVEDGLRQLLGEAEPPPPEEPGPTVAGRVPGAVAIAGASCPRTSPGWWRRRSASTTRRRRRWPPATSATYQAASTSSPRSSTRLAELTGK